MEVIEIPVKDIIPYVNNARDHRDAQIDLLARGIEEFDFSSVVVVDENYVILAGHAR